MENRVSHKSLVPVWVVTFATGFPDSSRVLPAVHGSLLGRVIGTYFGTAYLALMLPWWIVGVAAITLNFNDWISSNLKEQIIFNSYWLILPMFLVVGMPIARAIGFYWLAKTWKRITGEECPEESWYNSYKRNAEVLSILTTLARQVRNGEIQDSQFHMARDIAALRGLCDSDLRIRDLVKGT